MPLRGNEIETDYSQAYKDEAFYIWYRNSRVSLPELEKLLPLDERNKKPRIPSILRWKNDANWDTWADSLDAKVSDQLDMTVITERVEMYRKHAEMGQDLASKGMEYIKTEGIASDSAAIRAIVEGINIEGKNRGLADALSRVFSMSEKEIDVELKKMLTTKGGDDGIIDLESSDVEEVEDE
ncbi:MAG: hypothetical protein MUO21_05595 [Nitrososphaeraceae archaeon]|nr:hypothetical protein [Nitrososphaeraceae archaeon]